MNFHLNIALARPHSFDICTNISIVFSMSIILVSISDLFFSPEVSLKEFDF